jgi:hypothetical protein
MAAERKDKLRSRGQEAPKEASLEVAPEAIDFPRLGRVRPVEQPLALLGRRSAVGRVKPVEELLADDALAPTVGGRVENADEGKCVQRG